jgi:hypothetical protein
MMAGKHIPGQPGEAAPMHNATQRKKDAYQRADSSLPHSEEQNAWGAQLLIEGGEAGYQRDSLRVVLRKQRQGST